MSEFHQDNYLERLRSAMQRSLYAVNAKQDLDSADKKEEDAASRKRDAEIQTIVEQNEDAKANRELRWRYAKWVFSCLVSYSIFVGLILLLSGFDIFGFHLADDVLGFLVGSTAVSAIGLVAAVVTGLFRRP